MDVALPTLKTLSECSDFGKTVSPFLPQLRALPERILQSWSSPAALKDVYLSTNPLVTALAFALFLFPIFFFAAEVNRNYSQVDRFWSILPSVFNAHFVMYAHLVELPTQRLDTLLAISVLWSCRLTFNYWRKGGYLIGSEDYRWEVLRKYINPPLFWVFNLVFISFLQCMLLLAITSPTYILLLASQFTGDESSIGDLIISRSIAGLILLEWFADQQQWDFQQAKQAYRKTAKVPSPRFQAEDLDRGFIVSGLFSWSRHPNFVAEQAIWTLIYQWSCYTTESLYNWTVVGAVCYILLFRASTWFTELVSAKKYPEYKEYQMRVGMFLPRMSTALKQ